MLDEKFQMAYNLTYNTMATHKDVDTSMLRRAIWNYIHCMFGIRLVAGDFPFHVMSGTNVASLFLPPVSVGLSDMMTMIMGR